jgi:hypothetical protein
MNEYRAVRVTAANGAATIRVVTNGAASPRRPGVEIRVHGVGDHAPFSALGEPGLDDTRIVRLGVGITSVLLTASVAAWITVIVETIWRAVTDAPDNALTRMVLCASGPAAIIAVVVVRMSRGRAGVATGPRCSSCHVVALLGLMVISYFAPAGRHYPPNTDSSWWKSLQDNTVDPMTYVLVASIATV